MPKEKTINPVQAHAKQLKRAEHKKTKAAVAAQRQDRLSKRDPARLERQIASLQSSSTPLRQRDKDLLASLERDLALVRKARGALPEQEERRKRPRRGSTGSGSDTDPEVRRIPMPRDTPPPVPREAKKKPIAADAQITYSSAPVMRDLKKEATGQKFAPAAVRRNIQKVKGGGLLEEEEYERLEKAGYAGGQPAAAEGNKPKEESSGQGVPGYRKVQMEEVEDDGT